MKIRIHGEDHDLDPGRLTFGEAVSIEKTIGVTFKEWSDLLSAGSMEAMQAYAYVLHKRSNPTARLGDIERMGLNELEFISEPGDADEAATGGSSADPTPAA